MVRIKNSYTTYRNHVYDNCRSIADPVVHEPFALAFSNVRKKEISCLFKRIVREGTLSTYLHRSRCASICALMKLKPFRLRLYVIPPPWFYVLVHHVLRLSPSFSPGRVRSHHVTQCYHERSWWIAIGTQYFVLSDISLPIRLRTRKKFSPLIT